MSTSPPNGAGSEGMPVDDLERADRALEQLAPTPLPEGARQRLDARLQGAFDEVLSTDQAVDADTAAVAPTTAAASGRGTDELSRRRRSGRRRSLVPATAGVAAGLVLLAGGVVGLSQLSLGGDDDAATLQTDQFDEMADDEGPEPSSVEESLAADLPVVIDEGRTAAEEDAPRLLDDPQLLALAQRGLSMEDGATLAEDVQRRVLGVAEVSGFDAAEEAEEAEEAEDGVAAAEDADQDRSEGPADAGMAPLITRDGERLDAGVTEDLRRCLTQLLDPGEQAVPVAIEVVTLDGGDAAIFGLLTLDPDTGAFSRIEAWTLALDSCQVLRFDQS